MVVCLGVLGLGLSTLGLMECKESRVEVLRFQLLSLCEI